MTTVEIARASQFRFPERLIIVCRKCHEPVSTIVCPKCGSEDYWVHLSSKPNCFTPIQERDK